MSNSVSKYWDITFLHINVKGRRFDYTKTWAKRLPKIVAKIKQVNPDVVTAVECQIVEAQEIAKAIGYKYVNYLGSSIFYRQQFTARTLKKYSWLQGYPHSAIVIELKNLNGMTVNVAASHLPPFAWRSRLRESQQRALCKLFDGWNDATFICTDANWKSTFEFFVGSLGWLSARKTAVYKTNQIMRTSGKINSKLFTPGNPIDYVIGKSGKTYPIKFNRYRIHSGVGASDHNFVEVTGRAGVAPIIITPPLTDPNPPIVIPEPPTV